MNSENGSRSERQSFVDREMQAWIRLLLDTLRVMIPVVTLLSSAPTYFLLWFVLRLITWLFYPRDVFRRADDYFYSLYQRAVLFFFENPLNAKVNFICSIVVRSRWIVSRVDSDLFSW